MACLKFNTKWPHLKFSYSIASHLLHIFRPTLSLLSTLCKLHECSFCVHEFLVGNEIVVKLQTNSKPKPWTSLFWQKNYVYCAPTNGTRPTFIIILREQANIIWLVATLGNFVVVVLEPIFYTFTNVLWASKAKKIIIIIIFWLIFQGQELIKIRFKNCKIRSIKFYSFRAFQQYQEWAPISERYLFLILLNFLWKKCSTFNQLCTMSLNAIELLPLLLPYSLRAFQWYKEHKEGCDGLGDLNITNEMKQPTFLIR